MVLGLRLRNSVSGYTSTGGRRDTLTFRAHAAAVASRDHPRDSGRGVREPPRLRLPPRVPWCRRHASPAARRSAPSPARPPSALTYRSHRARFKTRGGAGRGLGEAAQPHRGGGGEGGGPPEGDRGSGGWSGEDLEGSRKRACSGQRGGVCVQSGEGTKENPEGSRAEREAQDRTDRRHGPPGGRVAAVRPRGCPRRRAARDCPRGSDPIQDDPT